MNLIQIFKYFNSKNSIEFGITNFEFWMKKMNWMLNEIFQNSKFKIQIQWICFSIKFKWYPVKKHWFKYQFFGGEFYKKDLVTLSNMKIGIMISNSIKSMNNLIIIWIIFCKYFLGDFCKKHYKCFGPLHIRNDLMIKIIVGNNNSIGSTIMYWFFEKRLQIRVGR